MVVRDLSMAEYTRSQRFPDAGWLKATPRPLRQARLLYMQIRYVQNDGSGHRLRKGKFQPRPGSLSMEEELDPRIFASAC